MAIFQARKIFGVYQDEDSWAVASLSRAGNRVAVQESYDLSSVSEVMTVVPAAKSSVILNIPIQHILYRTFNVAPSVLEKNNRAKNIRAFLLRQNLPFKLDDCYWDFWVMAASLTLVAIKKELLEAYLDETKKLGFHIVGVYPLFVALYNVFIYNYPQSKERFIILNVRAKACDVIAYDNKKLWATPVSIGRLQIFEDHLAMGRFSSEIQRIINSYYLQIQADNKAPAPLYLSGYDINEKFVLSLKKALPEFEVSLLEPMREIVSGSIKDNSLARFLAVSCGLCLTHFKLKGLLNVNLVKDKMRSEANTFFLAASKAVVLILVAVVVLGVSLFNLKKFRALEERVSSFEAVKESILSELPQVKKMNEEKKYFQAACDYLDGRVRLQRLYLKSLAAISANKPAIVDMKKCYAFIKDAKLEVAIAGDSQRYQDLNEFMAKLKKEDGISNVKIDASAALAEDERSQKIGFTLSFASADNGIRDLGKYKSVPAIGKRETKSDKSRSP